MHWYCGVFLLQFFSSSTAYYHDTTRIMRKMNKALNDWQVLCTYVPTAVRYRYTFNTINQVNYWTLNSGATFEAFILKINFTHPAQTSSPLGLPFRQCAFDTPLHSWAFAFIICIPLAVLSSFVCCVNVRICDIYLMILKICWCHL